MIQLRALRHLLLNRIWTMTKFGICWRHRCSYRMEKQVLTDHEFITLPTKTQCSVHLTSVKVQGNLPRCCHTIRKSSQDKSSDMEGISSGHQTVQGEGETFVRIFKPQETWRLVLEDRREDLFAGAKSEILKQECKVDFLNTSTREFQREAHSSRLEMDNVNCGYEESSKRASQASRRTGSTRKGTSRKSHQKYP